MKIQYQNKSQQMTENQTLLYITQALKSCGGYWTLSNRGL